MNLRQKYLNDLENVFLSTLIKTPLKIEFFYFPTSLTENTVFHV